ncbi:MAG TPA: hypothetical protein DF613_04660 [Lachnospiraceae bacterium]|nr:hypothetical protein [Lachnospiraceae bacterium]
MKQFLCWVPYQGKGGLKTFHYEAVDNPALDMKGGASFPIIPVMSGYLEENEETELIAVVADYENARDNFGILREETGNICRAKNVHCNIREVQVPYDDGLEAQLDAFKKLVGCIEEESELYSCISYGSKPSSVVEIMTLRYARMVKHCSNECVAYGKVDFNTDKAYIYDVTALVYLDDILRVLAENDVLAPEEVIKYMLES